VSLISWLSVSLTPTSASVVYSLQVQYSCYEYFIQTKGVVALQRTTYCRSWYYFLVVLLSHLRVESYSAYTRDLSTITDKEHNVAIVFGSAVDDIAKEPRPVVRDRLLAALELYDNGAVDRIVVSGYEDEINQDYNEPDVMRRFLVAQGVNTTDITEDNQGDSSYDTCKNAKLGPID
jgi:vancomycin permeability regulator SanA